MILLGPVFTFLYTIFKRLERGFSYQTVGARAIQSSVFVALFLLFNLMTIFPRLIGNRFILPMAALNIATYFLFCFRSKYVRIVQKYSMTSGANVAIALVYLSLTLLLLALRHRLKMELF